MNRLPPETLQPLLFPKNGGITNVASTLLEGLHSKTPYLLSLQILPLTSQEYHINV